MGDGQSGSPPTLPFDEPTYSVSELCAEVRDVLRAAPARWVAGEVQRVRRSRAGHLYFELIEKGEEDQVVGKLEAVVWRRDASRIESRLRQEGQQIADGLEMRCRGELDFYPPFGRLQLVVGAVDSVFLLGRLAQRRQETLQALARAGLLELNRGLELSGVPLDLALVTSEGSAAYHDFLSTLRESGFGFRVLFIHAAVQGESAEREIASALMAAGGLGIDCTVLVRGGGARTDLAAFDSRHVAESVARSPVPVITGLGHDIDLSISDQVAHTRTKTPTQAGEVLVQRVQAAERLLEERARRIVDGCGDALEQERARMSRIESNLRVTSFRLQAESQRLERLQDLLGRVGAGHLGREHRLIIGLAGRLAIAAPRVLGRRETHAETALERVASAAQARVRTAELRLGGLQRLCSQLGPERTLARGFSITRDARGRVVTAREQVGANERLTTELAHGTLTSRVEE